MEHVRHPRSPPIADSATPFFWQADPFLLTPNRRAYFDDTTPQLRYTDKVQSSSRQPLYPKFLGLGSSNLEPPRSKPLFHGFEKPNFVRIAVLAVLCLCAYPALYILTLVAKDKSLFTVRLIVALWCSGVGFTLGYVLLAIGVRHLEAGSE